MLLIQNGEEKRLRNLSLHDTVFAQLFLSSVKVTVNVRVKGGTL